MISSEGAAGFGQAQALRQVAHVTLQRFQFSMDLDALRRASPKGVGDQRRE
jgi:hypothetical protein